MKVLKTWNANDNFRGEAIFAELDQEVHVENYDNELFVPHFRCKLSQGIETRG